MFDLLGLSCLANLGFEKKKNVELGEEEGALDGEREIYIYIYSEMNEKGFFIF